MSRVKLEFWQIVFQNCKTMGTKTLSQLCPAPGVPSLSPPLTPPGCVPSCQEVRNGTLSQPKLLALRAHVRTHMHTHAHGHMHAHTGMCTHRHTGSWAMLWDWGLLLTKGSSSWVSLLPSFLFSFCSLCFSRISLSLLPPFLVFTSYHLGIYVYSFESLNKGEKKASL